MTRLAVLADIHGNLPALDAVLQDMAPFRVETVVVAGDVINWGPFSAPVVERVVRNGWGVIRGNNEFYLLDYNTPRAPAEWADRAKFALLPWLHRNLNGRWRSAIAAWPDTLSLRFPDAPPLRIVHGSPRSPWESMYPILSDEEIEVFMTDVEEATVIAGHTHLPMDRRVGRWRILNPGSVGVPVDGRSGASYLLLEGTDEGWRPAFRRVHYDVAPLFREFERQGFLDECGVIGHLVLEEFRTARLQVHPFVRWRQAHYPNEPVTMALLERFSPTSRWAYTPLAYHVNRE
ncbi:MAG: metallophosphoesterase family protein [Candidatus Latescibacteria bacterium]|nr:metallophosphoesterase family protein [Candidatus Latescibacterota bacterium]